MEWKSEHDLLLLQEIVVSEPYRFRPSTRERGQVWEDIAERLNAKPAFNGRLKQKRSVRDRYTLLAKKYKKKVADEEKDTGISPEINEEDQILEEVVAKFEECETDNKGEKKEQDREKAIEMRKTSMEKLGETMKRNGSEEKEDESSYPKKRRASGTETLAYLKDKSEQGFALKKEELEVKKKEQELQEKVHKADNQKQQLAQLWQDIQRQQQQQQEQQQQQQQLMQQQMMMQTKLLMSLIEKLNSQEVSVLSNRNIRQIYFKFIELFPEIPET